MQLRSQEEAMPRLRATVFFLRGAAASQGSAGIWMDGVRLKVPLGLTDGLSERVVHFLERKVEMAGIWLTRASTNFFFFIPKNVTRERPIAQMPTQTRWC